MLQTRSRLPRLWGFDKIDCGMVEDLRARIARVYEKIERAALRSGRKPEDVTLIAVSKTVDTASIQQAVDAGINNLGENRVQEAAEKVERVIRPELRWHLIGHLQSNKVRHAARLFDVIHTVDSVDLVNRLDKIANELGRCPSLLVQVKLRDEPAKSGAAEEDLPGIIEAVDSAANLRLRGLMVIPPLSESQDGARACFSRLREILAVVNRGRPHDQQLVDLSMGMSGDFETAVEEGATMVRVGTAIFGSRRQ
jgi:pyridoxal phosphate enzyme (YggS family)